MQIMFRFIGERKGLFAANLGIRTFKELLPFYGPILTGIAVDLLSGSDRSLFGIDLFSNDLRSLWIIAAAMAILAFAKMVTGYAHTLIAAHMGRHVVEAARRDIANASMQMALDERRRFNSGDLLDRSLADTKGLRSFTQNVIIRVISNTVRAIWPLVFMFMLDWVMALVVLAVIPMQSLLSGLLQRRLQRLTRTARAAEATHTSVVKEALDGWSSVASVGGQDWVTSELQQTARASEDAKIVKKRTTAAIGAVISLFTALGIAACYAIGGWRIIDSGVLTGTASESALTVGELVAFIGVAKKTYAPFQAYTKIVSSYRTGLVNLERIAEVLDAPMIDPRVDGPELRVFDGEISLEGVGFTYADDADPTLDGLTGRIPGRTLTVITGSSGAGKTTLLRLLMGLDQPNVGTISVDGQDINVAQLASVQRAMALVPQEPMLFSGTLGENLMLGHEETSTEALLSACHQAGLLDFVRELPDGLDTQVGSGKHVLSGGQLRRMAIARALLREPSILLLDEPTAGLDEERSTQVLDTLRRIAQSATVIMVSHRRDPLAASDHHLILAGGTWMDGDGNGDRWRPEAPASLTVQTDDEAIATDEASADRELAATNGRSANGDNGHRPTAFSGALDHDAHLQNGAATNGTSTNGAATNGAAVASNGRQMAARVPEPVTMSRRSLGLSAMGRQITLEALDHGQPAARLLVLGGHRSSAPVQASAVHDALTAVAGEGDIGVAIAGIPNANPDGDFTENRRTVLGVDLSADYAGRLAIETAAVTNAIDAWQPDLVVDVGERRTTQRTGADIEVTILHPFVADGSSPEWLARIGGDIRRRLATSRWTVSVNIAPAGASSLTKATGVPLVQITAITPPHMATADRTTSALADLVVATSHAAALVGAAAYT